MKSANAIKKITSLLLGTALAFTSLGLSENTVTVNAEDAVENGAIVNFQANLFDYNQSTINAATLNKIVANMSDEAKKENTSAYFSKNYPAIMFHSSGNYGDATSAKYNQWNSLHSYWFHSDNCPWNNCTYNKTYNKSNNYAESTSMVMSTLGTDGLPVFRYYVADLFNPSVTSDKTCYTDTDVQFVYEDGYYILDSSKYGYTFHAASGDDSASLVKGSSNGGFWPFKNAVGVSTSDSYHFGLNLAVDFTMTEDGTYNDEDCVFEFSGDDDVWVFVDDTLAIDLGGIHDAESAKIDFANQEVRYYNGVTSQVIATKSFADLGFTGSKALNDNDQHTLHVFYLERGAGASNCKIKFNMPTINNQVSGDVSFVKQDGIAKTGLAGAEFTLYSDEACETALKTATSAEDTGLVTFENVTSGIYYMKETSTPEGYQENDKVYKVIVSGNTSSTLTMTILDNESGAVVKNSATVGGKTLTAIYNTESDDEISVTKTATLVDWNDRTYQIDLGVTADYVESVTTESSETVTKTETTPVDVILVLDNSGSMNFPGDLTAYTGTLDTSNCYYFYNSLYKDYVYRLYYEGGQWKYCFSDESKGDNDATLFENDGHYYLTRTRREGGYHDPGPSYTYSNEVTDFFTSPSNGSVTRYSKLIAAAEAFVASLPNDSKLGIVQFDTNGENKASNLLDITTLTNYNRSSVNYAIEHMKIDGGTRPDLAMTKAKTMFDSLSDDNSKFVVMMTDGCPDGGNGVTVDTCNTSMNGESGSVTAMKAAGATVFTIGLEVNETHMASAVTLLRNTATTKDSTVYYYPASSSELTTAFNNVTTVIKQETVKTETTTVYNKVYAGTVTDIVDARFEIPEDQVEALEADGATVTVNSDNTTTVTWTDVILADDTDAAHITENEDGTYTWLPTSTDDCKWTGSFTVKARDNYAGGNAITTNSPASKVTINTGLEGGTDIAFPQPKVNVKVKATAGAASDTIFLGQTLTDYFTDYQRDLVAGKNVMDYQDVNLTYEWKNQKGETVTGSPLEFQTYIKTLAPTEHTVYNLTIIATPKVPKAEETDTESPAVAAAISMKNSDNKLYQATSASADSSYTVDVKDGSITISKTYTGGFLDGLLYSDREKKLIDANQTAIFTVYRYAEGTGANTIKNDTTHAKAIESYQITITGQGSQVITGLKAGVYYVKEETSWSWSYDLNSTAESYTAAEGMDAASADGSNDGIFYVGQKVTQKTADPDKGSNVYTDCANAKVEMKNLLTDLAKTIYADTTNVLNVFKK